MKRGQLFLISLSLILILSIVPVSAGWFSNFWNKITGQAAIVEDANNADGTMQEGTCSGTPTACKEFATQNSCNTQLGCAWNVADNNETMTASVIAGTCLGIPTACTALEIQSSCNTQSGCV
jgi:hypothetical protein